MQARIEIPRTFVITYCTMDGFTGANPLWHTCLLLSESNQERQEMEVKACAGFYGLPATDQSDSLKNKVKNKAKLNVDLYGNCGWMRDEEIRYLDLGPGLQGVHFEVSEETYNEFKAKLARVRRGQDECVNDFAPFAELYDIKPKGAEVLLMASPPSVETLNVLPIKSDTAYVRTGDQLFYVNKAKNKCIEIAMDAAKLRVFDDEIKPAAVARSLLKHETEKVTEITAHTPDEAFRITPYEGGLATIFKWEKELAAKKEREPRLYRFEFFNPVDGPRTCKTHSLDMMEGFVKPEQHDRVASFFPAVSRFSGKMQPIILYSEGSTRKFVKPKTGEVIHSRNWADKDKKKPTVLIHAVPLREREMLSENTDELFNIDNGHEGEVNRLASTLIQLEAVFKDAKFENEDRAAERKEMLKLLRVHKKHFSKLDPNAAAEKPDMNAITGAAYRLMSWPRTEHEKILMNHIESATDLLEKMVEAINSPIQETPEGIASLAAYLPPAVQDKVINIIGEPRESELLRMC